MTETLGVLIRRIDNMLQRYTARYAKSLGLTHVQMSIIDFLYRIGDQKELYQNDVEHEFSISKSNTTALLQTMERKGLIVRIPSTQDSRYKRVMLTPKSQNLGQRIHKYLDAIDGQLVKSLEPNAELVTKRLTALESFLEQELKK